MTNIENLQVETITCSYGPEVECCRRLYESFDRFAPRQIGHVLMVPESPSTNQSLSSDLVALLNLSNLGLDAREVAAIVQSISRSASGQLRGALL